MSEQSVDAAWAEMQRSAPAVDAQYLLKRSMASAPRRTKMQPPSNAKTERHTSDIAHLMSLKSSSNGYAQQQQSPPSTRASFSLAMELNRLADERQSVRKQAAVTIEAHILHGSPEDLASYDFHDFAKALFKRFNDPVEKVREVCIRVASQFIAVEQDLLRVLPYMMPAISNRINSQWGYDEENQVFTRSEFLHDAFKRGRVYVNESEVTRVKPNEPSEEIRLLFLELIAALLRNAFAHNASSILHAYVFDILLILVGSVADDFHDVNIKACTLLRELCSHMVSVMKHFTVAFVRAAKNLLGHRLARVRIAAVECIQSLVACPNFEKCKGSGTEAIVDLIGHRDENVIPIAAFYTGEVRVNFFAKLDQDSNPQVRRAFYRMIEDWILNLPDRYDHESRLMPYLLSAVADELEEASRSAMETLAELGVRYEQEQGEDVLEMKQYGVDGKNPSYNYTKLLPAPFFGSRPSLGTRLYVRGRTRRFINPILRELENWQSPTRARAVRLLKCVLVYSEETITVDAHTLLQTLVKTWDHEKEDAEWMGHLYEVADLVGRFVEPKTYLPLLLARINGEHEVVGSVVSPSALAAALELLHCVMGGSLDRALLPHVQEITAALGNDTLATFETPRVKRAHATVVLQVLQLLQRKGTDAVSAFFLEHGRLTSLEKVYGQLFELSSELAAITDPEAAEIARQAVTMVKQLRTPAVLERATAA